MPNPSSDSDSPDAALNALREAVRHSPQNVPLRQHLADQLMAFGRPADAETEYREALALAPENSFLKRVPARSEPASGYF